MKLPQLSEIKEAIEQLVRQYERTEAALRDNLHVIRNDLEAMTNENKTIRASHADMYARFAKLLELCDEQDELADELRVDREDGSINVEVIREVLG
jgi:chromosome segregation ATPase